MAFIALPGTSDHNTTALHLHNRSTPHRPHGRFDQFEERAQRSAFGGADHQGDNRRNWHALQRDLLRESRRLTPTLINVQRPDLLVSGTHQVD
jgi:hypothetical protein